MSACIWMNILAMPLQRAEAANAAAHTPQSTLAMSYVQVHSSFGLRCDCELLIM